MEKEPVFSKLFEPMNIGSMTVKNRIVMAPMGTGFATKEGLITERAKAYYEARAKGGVGMVIVEAACVDFPRGIHDPVRLVIDGDVTLSGLTGLARVIKKHGARAVSQLHHAGRTARFKITGFQSVAPSPVPSPTSAYPQGELPKELTTAEIDEIINLYVQAAVRAQKAGFDGIEVHAAHGYLLAQFLSPFCNQRRDKYGGSLENRARLLIEILQTIRASVGTDFPLWCRINGQEYGIENGFTLEDAKKVAQMVNPLVDAIHVSAFSYGQTIMHLPDTPGALLPLAEAIKEVVTVPVIGVGRLSPELGEQAIREGKVDMIALGRELLADPDIPNKVFSGKLEDITPCIACFYCSDVGVVVGGAIACTVNGLLGRESECKIEPAKKSKKVAIIGGGSGGMEAARVLARRGHKVILLEKEGKLGGQVNLAIAPPHKKERMEPLLTYLETQLRKLNVEIRLNTEAGLKLIETLKPEVVVMATGAVPLIPAITGADLKNVVTTFDILAGQVETGPNVVIIGGGSTGCETAEFLVQQGKAVAVVEMLPALAVDMGFRDRQRLLSRIMNLPITFHTNTRCIEIQQKGISAMTGENKGQFIPADTVVLAVGVRPNNSLFLSLRAKGYETHLIGDCWHTGKIVDAIADGLRLGCAL